MVKQKAAAIVATSHGDAPLRNCFSLVDNHLTILEALEKRYESNRVASHIRTMTGADEAATAVCSKPTPLIRPQIYPRPNCPKLDQTSSPSKFGGMLDHAVYFLQCKQTSIWIYRTTN